MDLLKAIQDYVNKLIEYGYYPKRKKPSLGKLEKMADLCMDRRFRKLTRYVPGDVSADRQEEFNALMNRIKEIVDNEQKEGN